MSRNYSCWSKVAALMAPLALLGPGLGAQVTGLPVFNSGVTRGFTLGAEIGFPNQNTGNGTAYGVRGAYGAGRLGISGVLSQYDVDAPFPNQTALGLAASLQLYGHPVLGPGATLQAGAELFTLDGGSKLHLPIGLGLRVGIPTRHAVLRPWIAPRLDIFRNSFDDPAHTETSFGLSGGLTVMGRRGFGVTFAVDRTFMGDGFHPSTLSVGIQYHFRSRVHR